MRKFTLLKMMLLAVVMMAGSVALKAQGSETFETQAVITAAYADGTFSSETAGVTVNFGHSRTTKVSDTEDYSISGKGLMLRRASDSYLEFVIPTGGVGKFSFQYSKAFTGGSPRQLELLVNGVQVGTTDEYGGATGADATVYDFSNDVNTPGAVTIRIKNVGATTGNRQTSIDNVTWTGYAGTPTPSITTDPTSLDFGSVDIGAVSAVKTVTVTGTNLTAAPAYSVNNSEFSVTGTLTTAGGTLTVTYSPAAAVAGNGIITISGNGQTATVVLAGSGVLPSLSKPVATDATGISQTGFTANWDAVSGAQSYKLDVYTKTSTGSVKATDLFFSEYVEGSSNNKYLEIYNGTGATVDLSSYKVVLFANGGTTATNTYELTGEIENGAVIVLRNSSASIYTGESIVSSTTNFNGDDAVALMKGDAYVDIIGKVGERTEWVADGGYSTLNKTLVRKSSVTSGVTTNPDAGFPTLATEWDVYDIDNVSNLGSHTLTDQLMETKTPVTGSPFTTTGTSQVVDGLVNTGMYYYSVTAIRGEEESPLSNEIGPISLTATGLSTAKVDALAWTSNGKVMLNATAGEVIEIFNVAGQKVVSRLAVDGLNSVDVSAKGVVIVRVNNRISKVIL